jgi:hypothetical protein
MAVVASRQGVAGQGEGCGGAEHDQGAEPAQHAEHGAGQQHDDDPGQGHEQQRHDLAVGVVHVGLDRRQGPGAVGVARGQGGGWRLGGQPARRFTTWSRRHGGWVMPPLPDSSVQGLTGGACSA